MTRQGESWQRFIPAGKERCCGSPKRPSTLWNSSSCAKRRPCGASSAPSIGPASFQVGEEVAEQFKHAGFPLEMIWTFQGAGDGSPMSGGHHIDLWTANRWLLEQAGVPTEGIQTCGIDTYTAPAFYSARRESVRCGRIINAIRLV